MPLRGACESGGVRGVRDTRQYRERVSACPRLHTPIACTAHAIGPWRHVGLRAHRALVGDMERQPTTAPANKVLEQWLDAAAEHGGGQRRGALNLGENGIYAAQRRAPPDQVPGRSLAARRDMLRHSRTHRVLTRRYRAR